MSLLLLLVSLASAQITSMATFPAGTSGRPQYNRSGLFGAEPYAFVAADGSSTTLKNAVAAGGEVRLSSSVVITSTLTLTQPGLRLVGRGSKNAPVRITKAAGYHGCAVLISTNNVTIEDLLIVGASSNQGDGICIEGRAAIVNNVRVETMGRDGVRNGCTELDGCNANVAKMFAVDSYDNGRWGFNWDYFAGSLPDANAGYCIGCFAQLNSSDGFRHNNSWDVSLIASLADNNEGYAIRLSSMSRGFNIIGGDFNEGDDLGALRIEVGARDYSLSGNVNLGTINNEGSTPLIQISNAHNIAIHGGTANGGLVVGGTKTSSSNRVFEVRDNQDLGESSGDFYVAPDDNIVMFGRVSNTAGTSTKVRMQGRTGNRVMEWNTTGGAVSYWNPSGSGTIYCIGRDDCVERGLTVNNAVYVGLAGTQSTIAYNGSMYMAPGSTFSMTGPISTIVTQSSITGSAFFGDGSKLSGVNKSIWQVTASSAIGAGTDVMHMSSYTVSANVLVNPGDTLWIVAQATFTSTSQVKDFDIKVNGNVCTGTSPTSTRTRVISECRIVRKDAGNMRYYGQNMFGGGVGELGSSTLSIDSSLSTAITVTITGSSAAGILGDVTLEHAHMTFIPGVAQ